MLRILLSLSLSTEQMSHKCTGVLYMVQCIPSHAVCTTVYTTSKTTNDSKNYFKNPANSWPGPRLPLRRSGDPVSSLPHALAGWPITDLRGLSYVVRPSNTPQLHLGRRRFPSPENVPKGYVSCAAQFTAVMRIDVQIYPLEMNGVGEGLVL